MTQKEIVRALRQKIPVEQVLDLYKIKSQPKKRRDLTTKRKSLIREKPLCIKNAAERAEAIAPRRIVPRESYQEPFQEPPKRSKRSRYLPQLLNLPLSQRESGSGSMWMSLTAPSPQG